MTIWKKWRHLSRGARRVVGMTAIAGTVALAAWGCDQQLDGDPVVASTQSALTSPVQWSATPRTLRYAITYSKAFNSFGQPTSVTTHSETLVVNSNRTISVTGSNLDGTTVPFDANRLVTTDANTNSIDTDLTYLRLPGDGTTQVTPTAADTDSNIVVQTQYATSVGAPSGGQIAFTETMGFRVPNNTQGIKDFVNSNNDPGVLATIPQTFTNYGSCSGKYDVASGTLLSKHCTFVLLPKAGSTTPITSDPNRVVVDFVKQ